MSRVCQVRTLSFRVVRCHMSYEIKSTKLITEPQAVDDVDVSALDLVSDPQTRPPQPQEGKCLPSAVLENTSKCPGANVWCLQEEIKSLTVGPENSVCALTLRRSDRQLTVHLGNPPRPPSPL